MNHPFFFLIALLQAVALLTGCASPAKPEAMVPPAFEMVTRHPHTVSVSGKGGEVTDPMLTSEISTEDFVQAVSDAIQQSGVFSAVLRGQEADYRLHVSIVSVDQPLFGFSMTVRMSTRWRLTDSAGKILFEDFIRSEHTATPGDAFAGVKRLRLANEGAGRENIRQGVQRLSALTL